jgi:predicted TIM-barrel fold metal-dependent hydrolase
MIFDVHCHLGIEQVFGGETTEQEVLQMFIKNGINGAIIQPGLTYVSMTAQAEAHNRIIRFIKAHADHSLYGMASLNPHVEPEIYFEEVSRCVQQHGFVGLKLHPLGHGCDPLWEDGVLPFQVADDLGIPLMVHTGLGSPLADPSHLLARAKEFPDLRIVMAHMGVAEKVAEAILVMKECPNIFGDLSLVSDYLVKSIVEEVGADRLMFGSDVNPNCAMELAKIRHAVTDSDQLEWIFHKTAKRVYGVP